MFRAFYDAAGGEPPSQEDFNRIALEHGQEFVGPRSSGSVPGTSF
jgi:hypothetical protein